MLLPHRHFAAEQLPYEIKPNGKRIVEWLAIRRIIYCDLLFRNYVNFMSIKVCAGFYIMLIKLCLLYYVNHRINPPSTVSTCPVTKLASSLAR